MCFTVAAIRLLPPSLRRFEQVNLLAILVGIDLSTISLAVEPSDSRIIDLANGNAWMLSDLKQLELQAFDWFPSLLARVAGIVVGARQAGEMAQHLVTIRTDLQLTVSDCIMLIRAVWPTITLNGAWSEWTALIEALIAECRSTAELRQLIYWQAVCARWSGDYAQADDCLDRALALCDGEADLLHAYLLIEKSGAQRYWRHFASAKAICETARSTFVREQDQTGLSRFHLEMARIALDENLPAVAQEYLPDNMTGYRADALRAEALLALGDPEAAMKLAQQAQALAVYDRPNYARACANCARIALALASPDVAESWLVLALTAGERIQDRVGQARILTILGQLACEKSVPAEALPLLEQALESQQAIDDRTGMIFTLPLLLDVCGILAEHELNAADASSAANLVGKMQSYVAQLERLTRLTARCN